MWHESRREYKRKTEKKKPRWSTSFVKAQLPPLSRLFRHVFFERVISTLYVAPFQRYAVIHGENTAHPNGLRLRIKLVPTVMPA